MTEAYLHPVLTGRKSYRKMESQGIRFIPAFFTRNSLIYMIPCICMTGIQQEQDT